MIEQRKPLAITARRAGWTGCNISLQGVPEAGRIYLIKDKAVAPKEQVIAKWRRTSFLRDQKDPDAKGWLLSLIRCIEKLDANIFTLDQCYQFEDELRTSFPANRHIKPKIRQQLQVLRDKGFRNYYRCDRCWSEWSDCWSCECDDDCRVCGARHMSPVNSNDLTEIAIPRDELYVVLRSPDTATHAPDYYPVVFCPTLALARQWIDADEETRSCFFIAKTGLS